MADTKPVCITLLLINLKRDRTYAAGAQIRISSVQEMIEYPSEFMKKVETFELFHAFA